MVWRVLITASKAWSFLTLVLSVFLFATGDPNAIYVINLSFGAIMGKTGVQFLLEMKRGVK